MSANPRPFATATLSALRTPSPTLSDQIIRDAGSRIVEHNDYRRIERAVLGWLSEIHGEIIANERFPDFIAMNEDGLLGYEVKVLRSFERMLFTSPIVKSMLRGYLEVKEGNLSKFTMIVVISVEDFTLFKTPTDCLN